MNPRITLVDTLMISKSTVDNNKTDAASHGVVARMQNLPIEMIKEIGRSLDRRVIAAVANIQTHTELPYYQKQSLQ